MPVELQINTENATNILATGKIRDSRVAPLIGNVEIPPQAQPRSMVRGYNGSQIFNTTLAVVDTNEPPHCGVTGGKSYWLNYQPPTNGTITLDTLGSSYDTVMECYTYNGAPTNYASLISLGCADNSFVTNGASQLVIPVVSTRQYLVVVAGVNGAAGTASLNYNLNTNQLPLPPELIGPPAPQVIAAGNSTTLVAPVTGAGPLMFAWFKDGVPMAGQNSSSLFLPVLNTGNSGSYSFTVTNDLGSVSGAFAVKVVTPVTCTLTLLPGWVQLGFPTASGDFYTVEEAAGLLGTWTTWPGALVGNGLTNYFNVPVGGGKFYRVRIE